MGETTFVATPEGLKVHNYIDDAKSEGIAAFAFLPPASICIKVCASARGAG